MFTHERLTHYAAHPDEIPQPKLRNVNGVKVYAMDVSLKNESSLSYTDGMEAVGMWLEAMKVAASKETTAMWAAWWQEAFASAEVCRWWPSILGTFIQQRNSFSTYPRRVTWADSQDCLMRKKFDQSLADVASHQPSHLEIPPQQSQKSTSSNSST
ncbi:hypothetical protein FRC03_001236 [Tulasnella sp. 419]|nr:hypothetical protein FRC03_001236 [Tulasnella sp. 419]